MTVKPQKDTTNRELNLLSDLGEDWATVLEKGLSGGTPLKSVVLEINGSVRESDMVSLLNRSLSASVAEGLATDPLLKSLTLTVYGSVSCSAFISLKKGVLENSALRSLVLKVFGGLPENWMNICEALYAAKKSSLSLIIKPDLVNKIKTNVDTICSRVSKVSINFDSPFTQVRRTGDGDVLAKFLSLATYASYSTTAVA